MSDIFVSYANADRETAREIARALSGFGWSVWWDREIPFGESFDRVIERELAGARSVIVLWSRASIESDWVRNEARRGHGRRALIPARIEDVDPPLEFSNVQTADLAGWKPDQPHVEFDRLVAHLKGVLDETAAKKGPAAAASRPPAAPPAAVTRESEPRRQPSAMRWIAGAAAVAVVVGGLGFWWGGVDRRIEAPRLVGEHVVTAEKKVDESGPRPAQTHPVEREREPPGPVIEQPPAPGRPVERTSAASLPVAEPPQRAVPSLVGAMRDDAVARLREAGLALGREVMSDSSAAPGTVIAQRPAQGTRLPRDGVVDIEVARAAQIAVPDLRGMTLDAARRTITTARLEVGNVRRRATAEAGPGLVLAQGLERGTAVAPGTAVDLVIAEAPVVEPVVRSVEAGPLWNQKDAEKKCPTVCGKGKWTGHWRTTVQGRMSVCQCAF